MADLSLAPITCAFERAGVPEVIVSGEGPATLLPRGEGARATEILGSSTAGVGVIVSLPSGCLAWGSLSSRVAIELEAASAVTGAPLCEAGRSMGLAAAGAATSHLQGAVCAAMATCTAP